MSGAHTPGSWQWNDDGLNPITVYGPTDVDANDRPCAQTICELSDSPDDCGAANARLIAAAPDMLRALQAVIEKVAPLLQSNGYGYLGAIDGTHGVRAAIAKATGK